MKSGNFLSGALTLLLLSSCGSTSSEPTSGSVPSPRLVIDDTESARLALAAALRLIEGNGVTLPIVVPPASSRAVASFFASVRPIVQPQDTVSSSEYLFVTELAVRGSTASLTATARHGPIPANPSFSRGYIIHMSRSTSGQWSAEIFFVSVA